MPFGRAAADSLRLFLCAQAGESDPDSESLWGYRGNRAEMPGSFGRAGKLGLKFVVGMQHCDRTSPRSLETPKKAAVAWVFCFTQKTLPITLTPRNEFRAVD
jgi:hypothetical protein